VNALTLASTAAMTSGISRPVPSAARLGRSIDQEVTMGKTGRKRRGRKKKAANHGKRPNA